MLEAATGPVSPPTPPSPGQAAPAAILRVLSIVRLLISHGQQLVLRLQRAAQDPDVVEDAWHRFFSRNIPLILSRLAHGLKLAAALEARLARRAARGLDMPKPPARRPGRPPVEPAITGQKRDPNLLPTARQIAISVRRRGAGAVIAEICREFAIRPGDLSPALARELNDIIDTYGGNHLKLALSLLRRSPLSAQQWQASLGRLPPKYLKLVMADPVLVLPKQEPAPSTGPPPERRAA